MPGAPAAALVVGLLAGCDAGGGSELPPPNVLLISLDSTRRDLLSCYGRVPAHAPSRPTSPNIDRLAREGVRFLNAYSTSSWTLPSHMAILTGQPDLVHAVELEPLRVHDDRPLLAEVLASYGYRTAGFFSGPYLAPAYGFDRGFERYESCYGEELTQAAAAQEAIESELRAGEPDAQRLPDMMREMTAAAARVEELSHTDVNSTRVTDAVLDELGRARGDARPWFVFAHYFDPHYDYVPPPPHDTAFDPDYAGSIDGRSFYTNPAISVREPDALRPHWRRRTVGDRDLEHIRALYEGELEWTDQQLGRILDDLREHGELDRTLVILVADHGDEFFEHGNIGHRRTLFEEVVRVPLVMRYPARLPGGTTPAGVASGMDLFATVLDVVGVKPPEGLLSRTLLPLVRAPADASLGRAVGRLVDPQLVTTAYGPGQFVCVRETLLKWPIKIRRVRKWIDETPMTPPSARASMHARAKRDRGVDTQLAWIDLERSPRERPQDWSKQFSGRAQAVLEDFQALYRKMVTLRRKPLIADQGGASRSMLGGLGYTGVDAADAEDLALERFVFPPPGTDD